MRQKNREIKELDEIIKVIEKCDVCRVVFNDNKYPYIVPMNFGVDIEKGNIVLYFHGAHQGKKHDLMEKDNNVCFEMDCSHNLIMDERSCYCTMEYESVVGFGKIEIVPENEKTKALCVMMRHYSKEDNSFERGALESTRVLKLTVDSCTGKRYMKKR